MPEAELGFGDVVDLRPVPVDDDGNLFISLVINDWAVVTQRGIDTVVDLEGGLDVGVPAAPNERLYLYFPIFDEVLPNLDNSTALPRCARRLSAAATGCCLIAAWD